MNYISFLLNMIFVVSVSIGSDAKLDNKNKSNTEASQVLPNIKPYPDQVEYATKNKSMELKNEAEVTSRVKLFPEAKEKRVKIPAGEKPYIEEEMKVQKAPIKEKADLNVKKEQSEAHQAVLPFPSHEKNSTDVLPKVDPYSEETKNK